MLSKNVCTALCLLIVILPPTKNLFCLLHNQRALIGCPTETVAACGQSAPRTVQPSQRSQPLHPTSFCFLFCNVTNDGPFLGYSVFQAHMQICNDEEKECICKLFFSTRSSKFGLVLFFFFFICSASLH